MRAVWLVLLAACGSSPSSPRCEPRFVETAAYDVSFPVVAVAAGDFDADGSVDLYVRGGDAGLARANISERALLHGGGDQLTLRQLPDSTFACDRIVVADVTGDGLADVLCVHRGRTLEVDAAPSFGTSFAPATNAQDVAAWSAFSASPIIGVSATSDVYAYTLAPTLEPTTLAQAPSPQLTSVATGDVDGDGTPDLLVAGPGNVGYEVSVYNAGLGHRDYAIPTARSIELADLDRDGALELLDFGEQSVAVLRLPDGAPGVPVFYSAPTAEHVVLDLNRDELPDVVYLDDAPAVLLAQPDGTLAGPVALALETQASHVWARTAADLDSDGLPELILADGNTVRVLAGVCESR